MSTRRPTLAALRRHATTSAAENDESSTPAQAQNNHDDVREDKKQKTGKGGKRRKTGSTSDVDLPVRRVRGNRGALKDIAEMPMDVVFEIFSNLLPLDLLHLARTSKGLRNILLDISSKSIWKNARGNVHRLPDCPDDMSEPLYANLAFETNCHACQRPNAGKTCWIYRVRVCKLCFTLRYERQCDDANCFMRPYGGRDPHYPSHIIRHHHNEYDALTSAEEQKAYVDHLTTKYNARDQAARKIRFWIGDRASRRSVELDAIRTQRLNDVIEKLKEQGWSADLDEEGIKEIAESKEVRKPQKLTERAWDRVLKGLDPVFEQFRHRRSERVKIGRGLVIDQHFRQHKTTLPPGSMVPPLSDLIGIPEFQYLFNGDEKDEDTPVDVESIPGVVAKYVARWRAHASEKLIAMLNESSDFNGSATQSTITAAPVRFRCEACDFICSVPALCEHDCFLPYISTHDYSLGNGWIGSFGFDQVRLGPAYATVRRVCEDLGLDPNMTNHEMIDRKDHFRSICCPSSRDGSITWEDLMNMLYQSPCCARFNYAFN